jgi:16S rRNA (cytosine1407-C5)-methyltransferase
MTKRKNKDDTAVKKRTQLVMRTSQVLSIGEEKAEELLSTSLKPSVRINPLAGDPTEIIEKMTSLGWKGSPISWCENGYTVDEGFIQLRDSQLVNDGQIYLQNEASWLPVVLLDPKPGMEVLEVCAAPGGKTSHIAALMKNEGYLVANDNSRPRLMKLQQNLTRLHVAADYTLHDATRLSHKLDGQQFDAILLDAPCSGEGLINLQRPKTLESWSVAHVKRLSTLQKQLIREAWSVLKPGGRLVYSTCTMAPEEDEAVISYLLKYNDDATIKGINLTIPGARTGVTKWGERVFHPDVSKAMRLIPGSGREAFFVCVIEKGYKSGE